RLAPLLEEKLKSLPDLVGVTTDLQVRNPQGNVRILRDRAQARGGTARAIEDALADAHGPRQSTMIYAPDHEDQVILEADRRYRRDRSALSLLYVRSASGQLVPLDELVETERGVGPVQVNHTGQLPSVTVSFAVRPGASLGDALAQINASA